MMRFVRVLAVTLSALLAACAGTAPTPTLTPVPSNTPTPPATATPTRAPIPTPPDAEPTPIPLQLTPLAGVGAAPPVTMNFPPGWAYAYDTLALVDVDNTLRPIPLAVYRGPVTGGTGTIVLLWGFPNFLAVSPLTLPGTPTPAPDLWSDGLRLFRLALVDAGCNAGTDLQRPYSVGGLAATGTQFAIVDCPESPDTRGWFAGLQVSGLNFVFYMYAEPITAMDSAWSELQAILDTAVFTLPQ
ncbi:MAG: hypothetical protein ACUVSX_07245 [Aggregatilineales bacterium]